ncbi:MAG: GntR family transcriptional regulator [Lautropia sp.]
MPIADKLLPFDLDRSRHAAPQVFDRLRVGIVSLVLEPGEVLQRAELAEAFGLSQTPVRDALMRLGEEGLVDIYPQHATLVSKIDVASARQAHFLRRSVEAEIVRGLALAPDPALIERLRALVDRQARLARSATEVEAFAAADLAFHQALYESAAVLQVWALIRRQSGHVDRLRRLHLPVKGKMQEVVRDHRRIVDAIAAGDPLAAAECLREHLSGTLAQVEAIRLRHPSYLTGFDRQPKV